MKICIFGAGAIGGFIAGHMVRARKNVSLLARGETLAAIRESGLTVEHGPGVFNVHPRCRSVPEDIGPVDVVIVAVKGPALPAVARTIGPLLGPTTSVIFAMNGIPWWYDHGRGARSGAVNDLLDPDGDLQRIIGGHRAIGCVVDCPTRVARPGHVVCNIDGTGKFTLGEPDGSNSERVRMLASLFETSGMAAPVSTEIRTVIWTKLVINLSRSPLAVLTGASELDLARAPGITGICEAMILEAVAVARSHGICLDLDMHSLLDAAFRVEHRPSMLQDWDAGRPMEIDTIVGIVSRLGGEAGVATPVVDRILALLTLKAARAGLH